MNGAGVPAAVAFARLVKQRYTAPAHEHAKKLRILAPQILATASRGVILEAATHIERLANMLGELTRPDGEDRYRKPLESADELRTWIENDMRENPEVWRAILGGAKP